jgi:hypothetical protein
MFHDQYFNYTQEVSLYQDDYNLSPRLELSYTIASASVFGSTYVTALMIDTEREAQIGVGTSWPYGPI